MHFENNNLSRESSFLSSPQDDFITVYYKIHYTAPFGMSVYLCGSSILLGIWHPSSAVRMQWNQVRWWGYAKVDFTGRFLVNGSPHQPLGRSPH
jgi:hypothetical protein